MIDSLIKIPIRFIKFKSKLSIIRRISIKDFFIDENVIKVLREKLF